MHIDNRFFPLPLQFDIELLRRDLAQCEALQWTDHFNQKDYDGNWNGIALRSSSGSAQNILANTDIAYSDTPLMAQCTYFSRIVADFQCPIESVRLLALAPGSEIKTHRDSGLAYQYGCFRLHIPITTDDGVAFIVDGEHLEMKPGALWYANFDLPHSVKHEGKTRRIHLVIDGKRNEWTDELFGKAGYDFDEEQKGKKVPPSTLRQMLKHLKAMEQTSGVQNLISQIETQLQNSADTKSDPYSAPQLEEWLPVHIERLDQNLLCKWYYFDHVPYHEPFFHETLNLVRRFPVNRNANTVFSSLDFMEESCAQFSSLSPGVFIFHVSRCGSTLLSQMLSTIKDRFIVASEPVLLDEILRLPYQSEGLEQEMIDRAFMAGINALGRIRQGTETQFIIKTDSWHLFFYEQIRRLYPTTPIILLYRQPKEVFASHLRQPGIQTIPGILEAAFTGLEPTVLDRDGYTARLLLKYYNIIGNIAQEDPNVLLLDYNEGIPGFIETLSKALKTSFSDEETAQMLERSRYHSKQKNQLFSEPSVSDDYRELLEEAERAYNKIGKGSH